MTEFLKLHQLNIMLVLSGICGIIAFFVAVTRTLPKKRKFALLFIEISASILLFSDRMAYLYRGNESSVGFWMVRIMNFLVFFMTLSTLHAFNLYLADLCINEVGLEKVPMRLRVVKILVALGQFMVILSQSSTDLPVLPLHSSLTTQRCTEPLPCQQ